MNQPISIFIIHKTNTDPSFLPRKVLNHKNLESINIFKFNKNVKNFPNLNNFMFPKQRITDSLWMITYQKLYQKLFI